MIAIKAGRSPQAAKATLSHTGALAGSYEVYRTAFDRAGIITVDTLTELFDAAEILCAYRQPSGDRLGIVTNGGGAGILAVDALLDVEASLADISADTIAALDRALPATWSHGNPGAIMRDPGVDAVLVMNCPTATSQAIDIATAVGDEVGLCRKAGFVKPVIACWLGDANAAAVRPILTANAIPLYGTPENAVRSFAYLLAAQRAKAALTDAPSVRHETRRAIEDAQVIIDHVRAERRTILSEVEAKALLDAYHIPTVATRFADSVAAVGDACDSLTPPYAVKIVSPDLSHKSDVGGVVLDLPDRAAACAAAAAMRDRIARDHPQARLVGYSVQTMIERPHAHELIVGIATDPTFGPVLMVGAGGTAVELIADKAMALAPIDHGQASAMIARTRISKLLAGYRQEPAADLEGIAVVLDALSAMAVDLPELVELDINPLLADAQGVLALDARIRITETATVQSRLVIRPAPLQRAADLTTRSGFMVHADPDSPGVRVARRTVEPAAPVDVS